MTEVTNVLEMVGVADVKATGELLGVWLSASAELGGVATTAASLVEVAVIGVLEGLVTGVLLETDATDLLESLPVWMETLYAETVKTASVPTNYD